jgi:hypothetical protein
VALTDNLVSYWKLDESSGNASDSVGSNTGVNTDVTYAAAKINNGGVFNGTSAVLACGTTSIPTGDFSISLWFKLSDQTTNGMLFSICDNNATAINNRIEVRANDAGAGQISLSGWFSTANYVLTNGANYNDSTLHHLVVMRSGANWSMYIDGSLVAGPTSKSNTALSINWVSMGVLRYGATPTLTAYFKGTLDEVGIWNRALSGTEVTALYNSGAGFQYPFLTAYTLAVDTMALALTYADVTLTKAIKLIVDTMALTFNFADVMFGNAYTLVVDTMALTLTYADVTLKKAVKLVVDTMSLVLDFKNVILKKIGWNNDTKPTSNWTEDSKPASSWTNDTK